MWSQIMIFTDTLHYIRYTCSNLTLDVRNNWLTATQIEWSTLTQWTNVKNLSVHIPWTRIYPLSLSPFYSFVWNVKKNYTLYIRCGCHSLSITEVKVHISTPTYLNSIDWIKKYECTFTFLFHYCYSLQTITRISFYTQRDNRWTDLFN